MSKDRTGPSQPNPPTGAPPTGAPGKRTRTGRLAAAPVAFPKTRAGHISARELFTVTNTTSERVRVTSVVEHSVSKGEFKLDGLPDVGPFESKRVTASVVPAVAGVRNVRFELFDSDDEYAGELIATTNAVDAPKLRCDSLPTVRDDARASSGADAEGSRARSGSSPRESMRRSFSAPHR